MIKERSKEVYKEEQMKFLWKLYHKDSEDLEEKEKGVSAKEVR
jgi:hypothetical protein